MTSLLLATSGALLLLLGWQLPPAIPAALARPLALLGGVPLDPGLLALTAFLCGVSLLAAAIAWLRPATGRLSPVDLTLAALLVCFVCAYAMARVNFTTVPYEDAAMLMRYARNFAAGHGIVWNIGEPPVDGATDFLYMLGVGWLVQAGAALEFATRALPFTAHAATVVLVYLFLRLGQRAGRLPALFSALYLAVGPALSITAAYFGAPFFALFAALAWCCALLLLDRPASWLAAAGLAGFGLVAGLVRPEGVILAGLMLLAVIYYHGLPPARRAITVFLLVFLLLGGAYFLWRWNYFGYPLPNPYYKKGGMSLHIGSLKPSFGALFSLALPFVPAWILALRSRPVRRLAAASLIPIAGFAAAFVLISNEMNFGARFQYPLLPLVLLSWYPLLREAPTDFRLPAWGSLETWGRRSLSLLAGAFMLLSLAYGASANQVANYNRDGRYDVARMLSEYQPYGYTMATSEAGLLPLYSGWRAVDTWGLNNAWIAHKGGITAGYLERYRPEIIIFHAYGSPLSPQNPAPADAWGRMALILQTYAEQHGYLLAADFGSSPGNTHYYYIRPDFPHSQEILRRLQQFDYTWIDDGSRAHNYAQPAP